MSATSETELRAEISWLEARNREVNLQRIEAETLARSQAARLDELERENAALREALKPFAAMADNWSQNFNDTQGFSTMPLPNYRAGDMQFQAEYTMGDLRRARAALTGEA